MATRPKDTTRDDTIHARTGKTRKDWYSIIDAFDCRTKGHKATAEYLQQFHKVDAWYAQGLTVEYERDHGIREVGQRCDGMFAATVSRTINVPIQRVWDAWADSAQVSKWFTTNANQDFREGGMYDNGDGDRGIYKRIVPLKRLIFTWENEKHCPGTRVAIDFVSKGESKTGIVITHEKLADKAGSDEMKMGWNWALTSLKSYLETGTPVNYEEWSQSQP